MNKKIPCGGFELDDSLTLDSEKKLGVNWDGQPSTTYLVTLDYNVDKYIVDKSYDDIKMAIDDGKYVVLYDPEEHYVLQLAHHSSNLIAFSRVTPYLISYVEIESNNAVSYDNIEIEGTKNWLCSYDVDGVMTPVESLEYIKLKSPNGTLYTISVTDDGTIQAQQNPIVPA